MPTIQEALVKLAINRSLYSSKNIHSGRAVTSLPYVTSPGNVTKALDGIKKAAVPERISQDFVKTILKIPGGSGTQITTFLKKIGLSSTDGTPTDLYRRFRNSEHSGSAIAQAIKIGYAALYTRNEFMHELSDPALLGLIVEATGQSADSTPVKLTHSCIKSLKSFAEFGDDEKDTPPVAAVDVHPLPRQHEDQPRRPSSLGLNLGYTINLNLPATADPEVFDAIFKSLKEHLLSVDDA